MRDESSVHDGAMISSMDVPGFASTPVVRFSGGNFEEFFHSEYSNFFESLPIVDVIAPNCPTNLKVVVNSNKKTFLFTWYYPTSANSPDKSIQNDIKEFEFYSVNDDNSLAVMGRMPIPRLLYTVGVDQIEKAQGKGLRFCVKAIDYHGLMSESSQIIRVFLNKDYGCKKEESNPTYESRNCGGSDTKFYMLKKYATFNKDIFTFSPGSSVAIKEPFKNNTNVVIVTVKDLNTGNIVEFEIDVIHQTIIKSKTVYGPATITSDIVDSIRTGGGRLVR
jgi:hypothetical protein